MKAAQGLVQIAFIISIVVKIVEAAAQNSFLNHFLNSRVHNSIYKYKHMTNCTIESGKLRRRRYKKTGKVFRLIKDLSLSKKDSVNMTDILVDRDSPGINWYEPNCIYTWKEEAPGENIGKSTAACANRTDVRENSIFIPLTTIKEKPTHDRRIEEARRIKRTSRKNRNIEKSIQIISRAIDMNICNFYANLIQNTTNVKKRNLLFIKYLDNLQCFERFEDPIWPNNLFSYNIIRRIDDHHSHSDILGLFILSKIHNSFPDAVVERNKLIERDELKTLEELEKELTENKEEISKQIEDTEKSFSNYTESSKSNFIEETACLLNNVKKQMAMYINILSAQGVDPLYKNGNVFSGYSFKEKKVRQKTAPWNTNLVNLMMKSLDEYELFTGDIHKLVKIIKETNRKIKKELGRKERKEHLILCFYVNAFIMALKNIDEVLGQRISNQHFLENREYSDRNKPKKKINEENKQICALLLDILLDMNSSMKLEEKDRLSRSILEEIVPTLDSIPKNYIKYEKSQEINAVVKEKKEKILNLLFSEIFAMQLSISKNKDFIAIKKVFRLRIENIIDIVFIKHAEWIDYSELGALNRIVDDDYVYIITHATPQIAKYLLEFANRFWYKTMCYEKFLIGMLESIKTREDIISWLIEEENLNSVFGIMKYTYSAYKYINILSTYSEIWNNPAILYLENYSNYKSAGYIVYKEDTSSSNLHIKHISFTDENLEAFRKARTPADIRKIKGKDENYNFY